MYQGTYNLKLEHHLNFLQVNVRGKNSLGAALNYWEEILDLCVEYEYQKVLIENETEGKLRISDLYNIGSSLFDIGFRTITIVFCDSDPQRIKNNKFTETVAINRGVIYKFFTDIEEAKYWLNDKDDDIDQYCSSLSYAI